MRFSPRHDHEAWEQTEKGTTFLPGDQCYLTSCLSGAVHPILGFQKHQSKENLQCKPLACILGKHFLCNFLCMLVCLYGLPLTCRDSKSRKVSFYIAPAKQRVLLHKDLSGTWWWWRWIKTTMLGVRDPRKRRQSSAESDNTEAENLLNRGWSKTPIPDCQS